jgi:hypothetical protein
MGGCFGNIAGNVSREVPSRTASEKAQVHIIIKALRSRLICDDERAQVWTTVLGRIELQDGVRV